MTTAGTINDPDGGGAVLATGTNTTTTLSSACVISAFDNGVWNPSGGSIGGGQIAIDGGFTIGNQSVSVTADGGLKLTENRTGSSMSVSIAPVPEPSTFALGAAGIACAAWLRHRRRAAARKA